MGGEGEGSERVESSNRGGMSGEGGLKGWGCASCIVASSAYRAQPASDPW